MLRDKTVHLIRAPFSRALLILIASLLAVLIFHSHIVAADADEYNWLTDEITVTLDDDLSGNDGDYGKYGQCTYQEVSLPNSWGYYQMTTACMFNAKSFIYTIYEGRLHVNLYGGVTLFPLEGWNFASNRFVLPSPETDDFIYNDLYIADLNDYLVPNNDALRPAYTLDSAHAKYLAEDETNYMQSADGYAISKNGMWMLISMTQIGYVSVNTESGEAHWIGPRRSSSEFHAISNDGNTLITGTFGYNPLRIYSTTNCGLKSDAIPSDWFSGEELSNQCVPREVDGEILSALNGQPYVLSSIPEFSQDGNTINIIVSSANMNISMAIGMSRESWSGIDYLALGDSYSSGEGDVERKDDGTSYYTLTSAGIGGCHISTRSYPFLLKQYNDISDEMMSSLACAGARLSKDYYGLSEGYLGQGDRLKDEVEEDRLSKQSEALTSFTPGLLKQIEFVREHKPKVVTFTGGGNDIKFSDIIYSCVTNTWGIGKNKSCEEVVDHSEKRIILGDAILTQYDQVVQFIAAIKEASPSTTVYVVGYPTFASDGSGPCLNGALLDQKERKGINEGVSYLNAVLAAAASKSGAYYRDVEDSLRGGRLCEGSQYMTGVINYFNGVEFAQMFHPNHLGHERLASAITVRGFSIAANDNPLPDSASEIPPRPESFGVKVHTPTFKEKLIEDISLVAGRAFTLARSTKSVFEIGNRVSVKLFSDPIRLADFTVVSQNDSDRTFVIPKGTPLGIHMLVVEVTSQSGEQSRYYQYVELKSGKSDDRDGDGIKDSQDPCLYIKNWYDEASGEDICKRKKVAGVIPGLGKGYGYGHLYSQGLHLGHGGHDTPLVLP